MNNTSTAYDGFGDKAVELAFSKLELLTDQTLPKISFDNSRTSLYHRGALCIFKFNANLQLQTQDETHDIENVKSTELISLNCGLTEKLMRGVKYSNLDLIDLINGLENNHTLCFQNVRFDTEIFDKLRNKGYNILFLPNIYHNGSYGGLMIASKNEFIDVEIYIGPPINSEFTEDSNPNVLNIQISAIIGGVRIYNYYCPSSCYEERMLTIENVYQNSNYDCRRLIVGNFNSDGRPSELTSTITKLPFGKIFRMVPSMVSTILSGGNSLNRIENVKIYKVLMQKYDQTHTFLQSAEPTYIVTVLPFFLWKRSPLMFLASQKDLVFANFTFFPRIEQGLIKNRGFCKIERRKICVIYFI